ncbi:MAG: hypothetical protein WCE63_03520 [Acidobacteriaceae bacterium]
MSAISEFDIEGVDIGLAVSLGTLREVLEGLSVGGKRWWIACEASSAFEMRALTIGHGDPGCSDRLNTLYFNVPVLNEQKPLAGTDGLILLLDSTVLSAVDPGLYIEGGRVLQDGFTDMECFFQPIRKALIAKLQE